MAGILSLRRSSAAALIGFRHIRAPSPPLLRHRLYAAAITAAAALPQLQHDYYSQNDQDLCRNIPSWAPLSDPEGVLPVRGVQWVFIGNPGVKKHIYAQKLSNLLEIPHISIHSLLRQDLSPRSSLYKQIAEAVNQGKLVPENIIFGLLTKRLKDGYYRGETGFILDGVPRTKLQAEMLDQLADIDLVVNFKSAEDCFMKYQGSIIFPHTCESSGTSNSSSKCLDMASHHNPPDSHAENAEDTRKEKLRFYAEQMKLLEEYYRKQRKLLDFQVNEAPSETWKRLLAALHLQHIHAAYSSQKLTSSSTRH